MTWHVSTDGEGKRSNASYRVSCARYPSDMINIEGDAFVMFPPAALSLPEKRICATIAVQLVGYYGGGIRLGDWFVGLGRERLDGLPSAPF